METAKSNKYLYALYCASFLLFGAVAIAFFLPRGFLGDSLASGLRLAIGMFSAVAALVAAVFLMVTMIISKTGMFSDAFTDHTTQAFNARYFKDKLDAELATAKSRSETLCLALIDIDDFRGFNNQYGHQTGDKVLAGVVQSIRRQSRKTDVICRTGGDEFAVIMPNTRLLDSQHLLDRINETLVLQLDGLKLRPRMSCGIASYPYHAREADMLYKLADDAMYWAKYHGKNQVTIFDFESMESFNGEERMRRAAELAYHNTAQTLALALDDRDETTRGHAKNVATLAEIFASRLNLSKHKIDMIRMAAMVHDIGKMGMLNLDSKDPETLTEEERVMLQQHPLLCREILVATDLAVVVPWVAAHHERWDGGGYPSGLEGGQIPYEARIIALCDEYENLTGPRRSGEPLSHSDAVAAIIKERGRRFDPVLTDSFVHLVDLLNSMMPDKNTVRPARVVESPESDAAETSQDAFYSIVRAKFR